MPIAVGEEIVGLAGTYRILARHGEGSFGVTYRAEDVAAGNQVIVKELRIEKLDDWKALDLFEREGRVLASVSHPNIPAFRDFFAHGGPAPLPVTELSRNTGGERLSLVLVQQYIAGSTLQQRIDQRRSLPPGEAIALLRPLLQALRHLHEHDPPLIHRDIKPGNIIVTKDGHPFLVDFGAIQDQLRSAGSVGSTIVGTLGYMPIEQTRGQARPSSDLYALGVTMVVALAGKPLEEISVDESTGALSIDDAVPRGTPKELRHLLHDMVTLLVAQRVQSAADVLERLDRPREKAHAAPKEHVEAPHAREKPAPSQQGSSEAKADEKRAMAIIGVFVVAGLVMGTGGVVASIKKKVPVVPSTPAAAPKRAKIDVVASQTACIKGDGPACTRAGRAFFWGTDGVLSDQIRGAGYYRQACELNDPEGCNLVGWCYLEGRVLGKDLALGTASLKKSCDAGYVSGCDSYAFALLNAQGVAPDEPRALALFTSACGSGNLHSCALAGIMHLYGRGTASNSTKAAEFFGQACGGVGPATEMSQCLLLDFNPEFCAIGGLEYTSGACGTTDPSRAETMLIRACRSGWRWACELPH